MTKPVITKQEDGKVKREHPSYAVVQVSRVSGKAELFDSSFSHQHFISLSIRPAIKHEDLTHSFIFPTNKEYIEVFMSETQFAQMITSINMGAGSPCTLNRLNNESIPKPDKEDQLNSQREMVAGSLEKVMDRQKGIADQIKKWRDEKHRPTLKELEEIHRDLESAVGNFSNNMSFYANCFEEHMEVTVGKAKAEIESHLLATAGRLGIQDVKPLEIE